MPPRNSESVETAIAADFEVDVASEASEPWHPTWEICVGENPASLFVDERNVESMVERIASGEAAGAADNFIEQATVRRPGDSVWIPLEQALAERAASASDRTGARIGALVFSFVFFPALLATFATIDFSVLVAVSAIAGLTSAGLIHRFGGKAVLGIFPLHSTLSAMLIAPFYGWVATFFMSTIGPIIPLYACVRVGSEVATVTASYLSRRRYQKWVRVAAMGRRRARNLDSLTSGDRDESIAS